MTKSEITKTNFSISIDIKLHKKLKKVAKAERSSVSHFVERAIAQAIEKIEKQDGVTIAELVEQNRQLRWDMLVIQKALGMEQGRRISSELERRFPNVPGECRDGLEDSPVYIGTRQCLQEEADDQLFSDIEYASEWVAEDIVNGEIEFEED